MDVAAVEALRSPEGRALLASLPPYEEAAALTLGERLRRDGHPPELVAAALTQSRLRAAATAKLGPQAGGLLYTATGLEQASRVEVAEAHARRIAGARPGRVLDLCCGIGSDLLALGRAGLRVTGVERDPVTAAVAAANVESVGLADRVDVVVDDAERVSLAGVDAVFVDPARRSGRGRLHEPGAWSPSWDFVRALPSRVAAVGAKLAPGIGHHLLPAGAEAEWVSVRGDVKECALWWGPLATATRRATLLPGGHSLTGDPSRRAAPGPLGRWLYEPDGAVIRAGLVAEVADLVGGGLVDTEIAYVTGDRLLSTPFARCYEVEESMPFSTKRLRAALAARRVGRLTVKKRGSAVEPDELRQAMRLRGEEEATVVLTRVAGAPTALLVRPVPLSPASSPAPPAG